MKVKNIQRRGILIIISLIIMFCYVFVMGCQVLEAKAAATKTAVFPVNNNCVVGFVYGYSESYGGTHKGIDLHDKKGDDTVYCAVSGTVYGTNNQCQHISSWNSNSADYGKCPQSHINTWGNSIYIKGDDGWYYVYGHLKYNSIKVEKNQRVTAGQPLATIGSSGASTGYHLHFEVRTKWGDSSSTVNVNKGVVFNYTNGPYGKSDPYQYETMTAGVYLLKNVGTGKYMAVSEAKAVNKQDIIIAAKKSTKDYQFKLSGGTENYLYSQIDNKFVVNPFSDTPSNGTNINLYEKSSDNTQTYKFEKVTDGYIIHSVYAPDCVLTVNSSNSVQLATRSDTKNQIWVLETPVSSLSNITVENVKKTDYYIGEAFDTDGIKITAKYEDGSTKDITASAKIEYDFSTAGTKKVIFNYTENNITKTTELAVTVKEIPTGFFAGSGTQNDPFLIQNKADLEKMRDLVNNTAYNPVYGRAYYLQTADIDLENENWVPIGLGFDGDDGHGDYNYKTRMFYGVYDGNEHYIKNLNVDGTWVNAGLFGVLRENTCEVRNVVVTGQVKTSDANAGGIVGQQQYSARIENCAFIGDVSANAIAGGITGYLYNGTSRQDNFCIANCYHMGSVNSDAYAGGLVGKILFNQYGNEQFYATIENSYQANGKISGNTIAGAICGAVIRNDNTTCKANIINCFAGTDCAANVGVKDATVDTSMLKSISDMKKLALDMGAPFADHSDSQLYDGYTIFAWQINRSLGDINLDGEVDVTDIIILQKWLLAVPDTQLANWKNADLCEDDKLTIFDWCLLKNKLLEK
ncbi:MAG: peptidoglycan DD-metalloendopeptidase family protein [Oscillospiraceae bacterium]|nr:peptidoglycan DD-metalloendopeptidase family protein [Oscillospiraceae bacterium]